MNTLIGILAEAAASQPVAPAPGWAKFLTGNNQLFMIVAVMVIMYIFILKNPRRAQEKKRAELLKTMKKGDRIQTIGGILGTVVEVREHEVVVKIDETTNTKMRFVREAIRGVVDGDKDKAETK